MATGPVGKCVTELPHGSRQVRIFDELMAHAPVACIKGGRGKERDPMYPPSLNMEVGKQ